MTNIFLPKEWTVTTNTGIGSFLMMVIKITSKSLHIQHLSRIYLSQVTTILSYYFCSPFLSHFELLGCQFLSQILAGAFALT